VLLIGANDHCTEQFEPASGSPCVQRSTWSTSRAGSVTDILHLGHLRISIGGKGTIVNEEAWIGVDREAWIELLLNGYECAY
jgi:hypothetical protein